MEKHHNKADGSTGIRYGAIVPLIGGFVIGNSMAVGHKPDVLYSYTPFAANEKHIKAYWPDVPYINLDEVKSPPVDRLDFVSTTCPCAGLSMLNYSKGKSNSSRGAEAAQNEWMYKSAKFVLENIKPRVFFGENAPALYGDGGDGVVQKLFEIAQEYGYSMSLVKTTTKKHGIPQNRNRTFYFLWDSEYAPVLDLYDRERKNLADYLAEVPVTASLQETFNTWKLEDLPLIRFLEEVKGFTWKEIMAEDAGTLNMLIVKKGWLDESIEYTDKVMPESTDARTMHHIKNKFLQGKGFWDGSPRLGTDHFNAVISKNMHCGAHPTEKRFITIREYMHLMGLPHDFELLDPKHSINHIAQNVPTTTARDWTLEVLKYIKGDLPSSGKKLYRQNNLTARSINDYVNAEKSATLF